ncbi:MAG: prenyltransferase [bacterium]|nr:prenyltransferase [bacterium]
MRLPFLTLVPVCVSLGAATSWHETGGINWFYLLLALLGGLAAHIGVNALNEYDDFKSGLDFKTVRTPFSGGSGALPGNPDKARTALIIGVVCLVVLGAVGTIFIRQWGWSIAPLGVLGAIVIVSYTPLLTRSPLLCLFAPGLGFGPLMVVGTHFALTGTYSTMALIASLVPLFLISGLLLMNQFPDLKADRDVGRRHLIIVYGPAAGVRVYRLLIAASALVVIFGVAAGPFSMLALISLAGHVIGIATSRGLARHRDNIPELIPYLGRNVLLTHAAPLLLTIGIFCG